MSSSKVHIISVNGPDLPIEKVVVFNDRAELKRLVQVELLPGMNEVHIQNISLSTIHDSMRVDGRGDAIIHEVLMKDKHMTNDERESPRVAELRNQLVAKEDELNRVKDRTAILNRRIEVLDKVVSDVGAGVLPKEGSVNVDDNVLASLTKMFSFYDQNSAVVRTELRENMRVQQKVEEEFNKLNNEFNNERNSMNNVTFSKYFVVSLESKEGGAVELDVVYQVHSASWRPSYDLRVETSGEQALKISYYAQVQQGTGEDWNEANMVLSTAQPCLGGQIPELGTLEASFFRPAPPPVHTMVRSFGAAPAGAQSLMMRNSTCDAMEERAPRMKKMVHSVASNVVEHALSTEFAIARPATIKANNEEHKVTIGIIDVSPQLVHECVPSKNLSVFLTASAINSSLLPFLPGQASVYLNNSFVAKTHMKSVSPGERFSASLGVDTAIRVEYKPAKKYHEQLGIINKSSSTVTEQVISLKNTRADPVLLTVKEHIPRSTDEKIKVRVAQPTVTPYEETSQTVGDAPSTPRAGAKMTAHHNLEWTVKLAGGEIKDLHLKWALEHPKEEKVEFAEKF